MPQTEMQRLYYRNGQIQQEAPEVDGELHGLLRTWHRNGVLASEQPYARGLLHGICRQWNENGELLGSFEMVRGTGIQSWWHDNGQLMTEISTVDGRFTGRSRIRLRDGTLIEEQFYLENRVVTMDEYLTVAEDDPRFPSYRGELAGNVAPQGPALERWQYALFIEALLAKSGRAEARSWLREIRGAESGAPSLGDIPTVAQALTLIDDLYSVGAVEIIATPIYSDSAGKEFADSIVVRLPADQSQRDAVRERCRDYCRTTGAGVLPEQDIGETHLYLRMA